MATGGASTPEERFDLVTEAARLAREARAGDPGTFDASGSSADAVVASLASRAGVDGITPSGRLPTVKRGMIKASMVFLREQAAFNRLMVTALEDLTARLDAIEARLTALEAASGTDSEPGA